MKKIITILFLNFLLSILNAQNYKCIKTDAISHFQNSDGTIASVRIDSVSQNGIITDYVSYYMIRPIGYDNYPMIYTLKGASWIGEKFRVMENGDNIFFNVLLEPIVIKTPVYLNSTWEMYHSDTFNIVVTATVSNIEYFSFLGLNDSVASINFSVKDTNGQTIQNLINNYTLRLSKNYGLISIFNFYNFPFINQIVNDGLYSISDTLHLIGLSNPVTGWQNITAYDIYNWFPGWEFHSSEWYNGAPGPSYSGGNSNQTIRRILSKVSTSDSIYYSIDRCYYQSSFDNTGTITNESSDRDTIVEKYYLNSSLNPLPFEPIIQNDNYITFHNKTLSNIMEQGWIFSNLHNDTCQALIYDGYVYFTWSIGLGSTYFGEGVFGDHSNYDFVYYKKDTIEWGTPYDCSTLLNIESFNKNKNEIRIYPNPNVGKFTLEFNNSNHSLVTISIEDITGKPIFKTIIRDDKYDFILQKLISGIYIMKIIKDNEIIITRLIKQ